MKIYFPVVYNVYLIDYGICLRLNNNIRCYKVNERDREEGEEWFRVLRHITSFLSYVNLNLSLSVGLK